MERERRTPEQDDEDEVKRLDRYERAVDRGDYERDLQKDRRMEELWEKEQEAKAGNGNQTSFTNEH